MYALTRGSESLLDYLKNQTFSTLPVEIWDRELWFYNKLLKRFDLPFMLKEKRLENSYFYINNQNDKTLGIAYAEVHEEYVELLIASTSEVGIFELIEIIKSTYALPLRISTTDEKLGIKLASRLGCTLQKDFVEYYYKFQKHHCEVENNNENSSNCINLEWKHIEKCPCSHLEELLTQELKCYGRVYENRIVSICAVAPITIQRAQLLGMRTYFEENEGRGYAKEVCFYALNEAKEHYAVVTMKVDLENNAAKKIAEQLDFTKMYVTYYFDVE